jgi:hypothetical protein
MGGRRHPLTWGNLLRAPGRLAQRESASFTPKRSLVRSQYRPPCRLAAGSTEHVAPAAIAVPARVSRGSRKPRHLPLTVRDRLTRAPTAASRDAHLRGRPGADAGPWLSPGGCRALARAERAPGPGLPGAGGLAWPFRAGRLSAVLWSGGGRCPWAGCPAVVLRGWAAGPVFPDGLPGRGSPGGVAGPVSSGWLPGCGPPRGAGLVFLGLDPGLWFSGVDRGPGLPGWAAWPWFSSDAWRARFPWAGCPAVVLKGSGGTGLPRAGSAAVVLRVGGGPGLHGRAGPAVMLRSRWRTWFPGLDAQPWSP